MAANFDPYHAWLGIPKGARPVNHYQLLGLAPFVSEPPIINEAAEERLELVQKYLAGEHAADARRLLDELAAAKSVLLQGASRKAYDVELRKQLGLPPAADAGPAKVAPAAAVAPAVAPAPAVPAPAPVMAAPMTAAPVSAAPLTAAPMIAAPVMAAPVMAAPVMAAPVMAAPVMAAPMMAAPVMAAPVMAGPVMAGPMVGTPAMAAPMMPGPVITGPMQPMGMPGGAFGQPDAGFAAANGAPVVRRSYRRRTSPSQAAIAVVVVAVVFLVGALGFALFQMTTGQPQVAKAPTPKEPPPPTVTFPRSSLPPGQKSPWATGAPVTPPKQDDVVKKDFIGGIGNAMSAESPSRNDPGMRPSTGRPEPPMVPQPMTPEPAKPEPPKPEPAKPTTPEPPKPPMVREPTKADAKESAAVMKNLAAVKAALAERNIAKAEEQLDLATLEASAGDMLLAIEHHRQLIDGVKQFWNAVTESVKGLKATEELTIDGKQVIVVEAAADKLSVKSEGRTLNFGIYRIPYSMAYFLAERWLNKGEAASSFVLGAFQAVDPKGSKDRAKALWQQAQAGGIDTSGLIAVLDAT